MQFDFPLQYVTGKELLRADTVRIRVPSGDTAAMELDDV